MNMKKIINTLLLNSSFIENIGLMNGKMGISIFFFHLAKETNNNTYQNYAEELIDEIYEEINKSTPLNFENGIAGIGWGIEYLVQEGFIEANTDEVLEEFDNLIFKQLLYNSPSKLGLLNGLLGIGFYLLKRIQNPNSCDDNIQTLTNKQTLMHLIDEIDRRLSSNVISSMLIDSTRTNTITYTEVEEADNVIFNPDNKTALLQTNFDLTWEYPLLIWFLTELKSLNIYNYKIENITIRLFSPLEQEKNWPLLQWKRLLLLLVIEQKRKYNSEEALSLKKVMKLANKEVLICNRIFLMEELYSNSVTVQYGTSGIAWVYFYLFKITNKEIFLREAHYWHGVQCSKSKKTISEFTEFDFESMECAFGILNGMAGYCLLNVLINIDF